MQSCSDSLGSGIQRYSCPLIPTCVPHLPAWSSQCKCVVIDVNCVWSPGQRLFKNARQSYSQYNRCKYFNRSAGCKNGDSCGFCHVHAFPRHLSGGNVNREDNVKLTTQQRRAYKASRTPEQREDSRIFSGMLNHLRDELRGYIDFGLPSHGVQFVVWSYPGGIDSALRVQRRVAELFLGGVDKSKDVGIWLGHDKMCTGPGVLSPGCSVVQDISMGGLFVRLSELEASLSRDVTGLVFLESDAQLVDRCRDSLEELSCKLSSEDFVHLGYFCNCVPNWYRLPDGRRRFKGSGHFPQHGCQMFWLHRRCLSALLHRLHVDQYPLGLDRFFFSPRWFPRYAFLSHSLAGQDAEQVDMLSGTCTSGLIEEPSVPISSMSVKSFEDTQFGRDHRRRVWCVNDVACFHEPESPDYAVVQSPCLQQRAGRKRSLS